MLCYLELSHIHRLQLFVTKAPGISNVDRACIKIIFALCGAGGNQYCYWYDYILEISTTASIDSGFGTARLYKGGIAIYIYDGNKWEQVFNEDMDVQAPHVKTMFETTKGDVWIAMAPRKGQTGALVDAGALINYKNGKWINVNKDLPCSGCKFVKGIFEDGNGRVWFWSRKDLFFYENNTFRLAKDDGFDLDNSFNINSGGQDKTIIPFKDSQKKLWIGSKFRINKFDGKEWRNFGKKNKALKEWKFP